MTQEELKKAGGSAFPSGDGMYAGGPCHDNGMTLRDYFASQALVGLIGISQAPPSSFAKESTRVAEIAFIVADAMLLQRKSR